MPSDKGSTYEVHPPRKTSSSECSEKLVCIECLFGVAKRRWSTWPDMQHLGTRDEGSPGRSEFEDWKGAKPNCMSGPAELDWRMSNALNGKRGWREMRPLTLRKVRMSSKSSRARRSFSHSATTARAACIRMSDVPCTPRPNRLNPSDHLHETVLHLQDIPYISSHRNCLCKTSPVMSH